jgi:hypothetical protein
MYDLPLCKYAGRQLHKPVIAQLWEFKGEWARKRTQMEVIFHMLQNGQPMLDYKSSQLLLQFPEVLRMLGQHWSDSSG